MPDSSDSWSGYPAERDALLAVMHTIPNLIIVSGDRHEAAIVEYTAPTPDGRIVLEVSTSPLSQMASPLRGLALRRESQEKVIRLRKKVIEELDPAADHVVTVEETVPREKLLKSFGSGNYKWCVGLARFR
jgi:alkaline phosphatase D